MNPRELELTLKLLARANPPPILHRYRKPHEWTLLEISEQKVHLTSPDDQNDPFESRTPIVFSKDSLRHSFVEIHAPSIGLSRADAEKEFESSCDLSAIENLYKRFEQIRKDSGMICLTAVPDSIRMWSYYAQAHEGVCLGFDSTKHPFFGALQVKYQNPGKPIDIVSVVDEDPTLLATEISARKAAEWSFEQEYRVSIGQIGENTRLVNFDPTALIEIRLGAKITDQFREKLLSSILKLPDFPKIIQMKCDFDRFILTEEVIAL